MNSLPLRDEPFGASGKAPLLAVEGVDIVESLLTTLERVPVGVVHFDRSGRLLFVNAHFCELLRYSRGELLSRTFAEITDEPDADECEELNSRVLDGTLPSYGREARFLRGDGSTAALRLQISPLHGADGDLMILIGVVDEATRDLARNYFATQDRFRAALDASRTGTFRWEVDSKYPEWDQNLDRLFGLGTLPRTHSLGGLLTMIHREDLDPVVENLWASLGDGGDFEDEFRVIWPDGSVHWIHLRGRTVIDESGVPLYVTGACTDITDRVRAEQAVRESEARLRRIVDSGMVGVFEWRGDGRIIEANEAFLGMLGYTRADLRAGRLDIRSIRANGWSEADETTLENVMRNGVASPVESDFIGRDGRTVPVLHAQARLEGSERQGIAVCLDVTERKRGEVERERLLSVEHQARYAAERAIRQRDEVLAIVAHDLRNPISTIQMSASTLLSLPLDQERRMRHCQIIQRAAANMESLIRDLLDVSRIESGTFAVRRETVDVPALIHETVELFEEQARHHEVVVECEIQKGVSQIPGDPDRLGQALSNLLSNAIKFSRPRGRVTIDARFVNEYVEISVVDTGPGIREDDLPHIFDRFWQVDRTSRAGAGLGLVIAKGIVESHGGRLDVRSELGRGTTFLCRLPAHAVPRPA